MLYLTWCIQCIVVTTHNPVTFTKINEVWLGRWLDWEGGLLGR